jgi:hypothetical protein
MPSIYPCRGSPIGIASGFDLDGRVSFPGNGKRFFSMPQQPDRLWGTPSLLSSGFIHYWLYSPLLCPGLFSFVIFFYADGMTPLTSDQPVARPLLTHRTTHTQTSMLWVGFEPTNSVFNRAKTVHASDRAATVIGSIQWLPRAVSPGTSVNLTAYLHAVPKSRMVELCLRSPISLYGGVLSQVQGQLYFLPLPYHEVMWVLGCILD